MWCGERSGGKRPSETRERRGAMRERGVDACGAGEAARCGRGDVRCGMGESQVEGERNATPNRNRHFGSSSRPHPEFRNDLRPSSSSLAAGESLGMQQLLRPSPAALHPRAATVAPPRSSGAAVVGAEMQHQTSCHWRPSAHELLSLILYSPLLSSPILSASSLPLPLPASYSSVTAAGGDGGGASPSFASSLSPWGRGTARRWRAAVGSSALPSGRRGGGGQGRRPLLRRIQRERRRRWYDISDPTGGEGRRWRPDVPAMVAPLPSAESSGRGAGGDLASLWLFGGDSGTLLFRLT
uniref:Uncharacterized protein n=1 Tax=Oryza sativa subsp. japonica TaxID=39947 RepID=Q84SY0_ORYSJ|nr:hypothetical protein [Oryza sativa Japonica Group]